jgi:hypothetical protein
MNESANKVQDKNDSDYVRCRGGENMSRLRILDEGQVGLNFRVSSRRGN